MSNAWLFITKSDEERSWAANQGYDDAVGFYYSYDSNVPNCQQVRSGDVVVVRQDDWVAGWAVIAGITTMPDSDKQISRCPECKATNWYERLSMSPPLKCSNCKHEFFPHELIREVSKVTAYRADYSASWVEAVRPISYRDLDPYLASRGTFNAIRPIKPDMVETLLEQIGARHIDLTVQTTDGKVGVILGGHIPAVVKRRRGQRQFRFKMMERFGESCAFSGSQPPEVLEAAHLYSFAEQPEHHPNGGLLLRRDFHTLFDAHLVSIDPTSWTLDVAERLRPYGPYWALRGQDLKVATDLRPDADLVASHREQFLIREHSSRS
jgi:hypothetical protein